VVPAGNVWPGFYTQQSLESVDQYPVNLLSDSHSAIIDPAPAALALTVGGLCLEAAAGGAGAEELAGRVPLGVGGWPSPISRHGPGISGSVKPELSANAGSVAFDLGLQAFVEDAELKIPSSSVGLPGRLIEADYGTSYAAPVVARTAAAIAKRYPTFGPNLVRALVLQAVAPSRFEGHLLGESASARRDALLKLVGFGEARHAEAFESVTHRTVLVAESEIPVDGVHIYEVPLPSSFFESGGRRSLAVSLAYDPETRVRRLDYLSNKMDFHLLRGASVELAQQLFLTTSEEEVESFEETAEDDRDVGDGESEPTLSKFVLNLDPPAQIRSRGTNQVGRKEFSQKLNADRYGESLLLVVRNTNYWATPGTVQPYGIAVALGRDEEHPSLYAELEARVQVPIEVEIGRSPA